MKQFAFVLCLAVGLAAGAIVPEYGNSNGDFDNGNNNGGGYGNSNGGGDGYGAPSTTTNCRDVIEVQNKEHCENFQETICTTVQKEACTEVGDQVCRGVVSANRVRKCFEVTDQKCQLVESVMVETVNVPVTVQKCRKAFETVCDTLSETDSVVKERVQCITVNNPKCTQVPQTVSDRTCKTTTTFDCDTSFSAPINAGGNQGNNANQGGNGGYGNNGNSGNQGGNGGYGQNQDNNNNAGYSSQNSYGVPEPNCRRSQETKCFKTPRTVSVPQCTSIPEKICEKLQEETPFVNSRQQCRQEEKKICDLVQTQQPKQVKKFSFNKVCRPVSRQVCDDADAKTLVPSCVPAARKRCVISPVESCQDIPRKQCFNLAFKVKKQVCEQEQQQQGYGNDNSNDGY